MEELERFHLLPIPRMTPDPVKTRLSESQAEGFIFRFLHLILLRQRSFNWPWIISVE